MKELAVLTYSEKAADLYCGNLEKLLRGKIHITKYCVEKDDINDRIGADLVMISAYDLYDLVKRYVPDDVQIMIPNLTIPKSSFQQIKNLPVGTRALLVNANFDMAVQSVEQIYQFGARHIELIPYSPYLEDIEDIAIAVTPGEKQNVPKWVETVIDIGNRVIDVSTIINILIYFNIEELFNTEDMKDYYRSIMPQNYNPRFQDKLNPFSMNDFLMANYRRGIIGFSPNGIILNYNSVAEKTLGHKKASIIGENILSLFPEPIIRETIRNLKPMQKKQIQINGRDLLVDITIGNVSSTKICYLIFEQIRESATKLPDYKSQAIGHGYVAKYSFDDIVTRNEELMNLKRIAELNAAFDSSVLILGESGTGKELFAQAIHNASKRKDNPFVAINCAAVAESLLESELFGYDEGAFTGARRGGKKGLFELAHCGTLFLDEIGEMQVHLQARLLRALQEKEITHIGGNRVISVDVRVIAATNRDITQLIQSGSFRKDLFYRLNVITLKLPNLSKRKEDLPLLIDEFKKQMGTDFTIHPFVMKEFQKHGWDGNIRELRNYIEYFQNLRKRQIDISDVPFLQMKATTRTQFEFGEHDRTRAEKEELGENLPEALYILEVLDDARINGRVLG
ncbi:MAG: sigma 54-interacting transcriptional regulator, partial [Treponemataceae bacterium]